MALSGFLGLQHFVLQHHFGLVSTLEKFHGAQRIPGRKTRVRLFRHPFPTPGKGQLFRSLYLAIDPAADIGNAFRRLHFNFVAPIRPHIQLQVTHLVRPDVAAHPMIQRRELGPRAEYFFSGRRESPPHLNRRSRARRLRRHLVASLASLPRYASSVFSSASKQPFQPLLWSARASALVKPSCVRNTSVKVPRG